MITLPLGRSPRLSAAGGWTGEAVWGPENLSVRDGMLPPYREPIKTMYNGKEQNFLLGSQDPPLLLATAIAFSP